MKARSTKDDTRTSRKVIAHYSETRGNSQFQLQKLADDIIKYGTKISETRHYSQKINPNGEERTIETGTRCVEVICNITRTRYWVHFSGCRISEIIEAYSLYKEEDIAPWEDLPGIIE